MERIRCCRVSWDETYRLARKLSHKVIDSGFEPDIVIGIARGGLVPARMVCDFLLHDELISLRTEHWGTASKKDKARIKFSLPEEADIYGKKILVADDVADSGDSFSVIIEYLGKMHPLNVRTAVLHYKTSSNVIPDYWGEKLEEWNWIIYPWALYEDIAGFVQELVSCPMTGEDIRKNLAKNFNIVISQKELIEVLNDLHKLGKIDKKFNKYY